MFFAPRHLLSTCLACVVLLCTAASLASSLEARGEAAKPWGPIWVKSHYGEYDPTLKEPGHAAPSLDRPRLENWSPPPPPGRAYTLGVCIPHLKDPYWKAVSYGIIDEARRLGVTVQIVQAGGYDRLDKQIDQMHALSQSGIDGLLLAAISYTGNDEAIREVHQRIPVVELINDVRSPDVQAKSLISFYDMGYYAGEFVVEQAEKRQLLNMKISFFPGPRESGWAPESLEGFREALTFFSGKAEIVDVRWGDTGRNLQQRLVRESLKKTGPVDYIVGNALAADAAPELLRQAEYEDTRIVSTYITPPLYDKIRARQIAAAPSDLTVFQGRMAVDMMVRLLNGEKPGKDLPFRAGPFTPMITPENYDRFPFEGLFGPRDFSPAKHTGSGG